MAKIAETVSRRRGGVIVRQVEPDSTADASGIEPGDKIYAINGIIIPDSLSFQFNIAHPEMILLVDKPSGERWELEIEQDEDVPFGVELEPDPIMLCRNKCVFCFVDQNPSGYRQSLLIKDEDIRLSFMYGNYSTLSSTDEDEEERIIRERISPLYVSVHATDPEVRIQMLKNKTTGNILQRLRHLTANGIDFHAQIVLCPGLNDGPILEKTLLELSELYPQCLSIAVVPLGITSHRKNLVNLTPVSDSFCAETIAFCKPFQQRFKRELGYPLVFLGDEFYIRAGQKIPSRAAYRNFPQMENGIGMVRRFLDGFENRLPKMKLEPGLRGTLVTGTLFGVYLEKLIAELNQSHGTEIQVAAIRNDSFGADLINVAGLVHGWDIINQLRGRDLGSFVVVPHVMLKDAVEDPIMIDDYRAEHLAQALQVPILVTGNRAQDLLAVLSNWRRHILAEPSQEPIEIPKPKHLVNA